MRVSVHVAQLVEGGIEVYTEDSKRALPAEAPSAQNGWNIVVYKPDTKRIAADVRCFPLPEIEVQGCQQKMKPASRYQ